MKQTLNTHACSLAREEAAYSLATGKAAAGTQESGEAVAYSLAREGRRQHVGSQYSGRDRKLIMACTVLHCAAHSSKAYM